jgi:hypothetical protein
MIWITSARRFTFAETGSANDVIDHLKPDSSAAPVPLGELLANMLRGWQQQTP